MPCWLTLRCLCLLERILCLTHTQHRLPHLPTSRRIWLLGRLSVQYIPEARHSSCQQQIGSCYRCTGSTLCQAKALLFEFCWLKHWYCWNLVHLRSQSWGKFFWNMRCNDRKCSRSCLWMHTPVTESAMLCTSSWCQALQEVRWVSSGYRWLLDCLCPSSSWR